MSDDNEQRLQELELKLTFQEDTLGALNDAIIAQQDRIDQLERLVERLVERARQGDPASLNPGEEPAPPHY